MNNQMAIGILIESAYVAQKSGLLSLEDATRILSAINFLKQERAQASMQAQQAMAAKAAGAVEKMKASVAKPDNFKKK